MVNPEKEISSSLGISSQGATRTIGSTLLTGQFNPPTTNDVRWANKRQRNEHEGSA